MGKIVTHKNKPIFLKGFEQNHRDGKWERFKRQKIEHKTKKY